MRARNKNTDVEYAGRLNKYNELKIKDGEKERKSKRERKMLTKQKGKGKKGRKGIKRKRDKHDNER